MCILTYHPLITSQCFGFLYLDESYARHLQDLFGSLHTAAPWVGCNECSLAVERLLEEFVDTVTAVTAGGNVLQEKGLVKICCGIGLRVGRNNNGELDWTRIGNRN